MDRDSILNHLPPLTPQYTYGSLAEFRSNLAVEGARFQHQLDASQYVLFTHLSPQAFRRDFQQPVRETIGHTEDSYLPRQQALLIKMKSGPHEAAHLEFNRIVIRKLGDMGSADEGLVPVGDKTIHATSRSKEADLAYRPLDRPEGRSKEWPTLALESGYTDSRDTLHSNANWWLSASHGDVKIVITIDMEKRNRHFNIRLYNRQPSGAINEQEVTVSQQFGTPNAAVKHAPLVISFRNLFLRDPTGVERDIEFNANDLGRLGRIIWDEQF